MKTDNPLKKILYVIDSFKVGGAQRQLLELVRHIDKTQFQVAICPIWDIPDLEPMFLDTDVEIFHIHKYFSYDLTIAFRLYKKICQFSPNIVHTWLFTGSLWGRIAAILAKTPIIITGERTVVPAHNLPYFIQPINRFLSRFNDVITTNSKIGITELIHNGYSPKKIRCIYNGVDTLRFSPQVKEQYREFMQEKLRLPSIPICVTVGRLTEQKGQYVLLTAIKKVIDAGKQIHCLIVGQGEQGEYLKKFVEKIGIENNVLFLGNRDDVEMILSAADVFCLSSFWEGMPNVVLEAMAMGLPVVATSVAGTQEAVIDGETGFLVPIGDSDELAKRLLLLIQNPGLQVNLGINGRQRAVNFFSLENMVDQTKSLYKEMLQEENIH